MARYVPNPGFEGQIKREPRFRAGMAETTSEVKRQVQAAAPNQTGHYRRSIRDDGERVWTTDIAGHIIEWGSSRTPPYAPLRRGVRAAGLRLDEAPKP